MKVKALMNLRLTDELVEKGKIIEVDQSNVETIESFLSMGWVEEVTESEIPTEILTGGLQDETED